MLYLKTSAHWKTDDGQVVDLDSRLLATLKAIGQQGSLTRASADLGVSYRTLWSQVQHYNTLLGQDLIATQGRAGATLTPLGHQILWMVEQGQVRAAPNVGIVAEQLNAEWLDANHNKPWISLALSDDYAMRHLFENTALHKSLHLSLRWLGSIAALSALHRGEVRVATCNLPVGGEEFAEVHQVMRRWLRGSNLSVIELFEREIGWISRPSMNPPTLDDVAQRRALLVNRNSASSTHEQLNALCRHAGLDPEQLPGYFHVEETHLGVACTIAAGHGDLGLGVRAAAEHYGLSFRPVSRERYFMVLHNDDLHFPAMNLLLPWLASDEVRNGLLNMPGYSAAALGQTSPLETFLSQLA